MTEYSNVELGRSIKRLEDSVDRIENKFDYMSDKFVSSNTLSLKVNPIETDVIELQEANRWLTRAVIGAMITAVIGSIVAALVGVIIRLPPV